MMVSRAIAKFIRMTPRKAMSVASLVRGKDLGEALALLKYLPRRDAADTFSKLIRSAAANAHENKKVDVDSLFVETIMVNKGPTLKRFRPRAMGRAFRVEKKTSHIEVQLGVR